MENVFENAKFGDKFRTRDGRLAIYLSTAYGGSVDDKYNPPFMIVYCAVEYHFKYEDGSEKYTYGIEKYNENGKWNKWNPEDDDLDIVGKWEEPIDEEKLTKMANEYMLHPDRTIESYSLLTEMMEAFKAGYRKAKEE